MELYTFLGFVIALIAYITSSAISLLNSNDKVSEAEIEKVVKHALEAEIAKSTVKAPVSKKIKVGRNEPCSCGSGKKHKKCCLLKK